MKRLAVVVGLIAALEMAVPVMAQSADAVDPAGMGQYAVGATSRNFQRTGLTGQRGLLTFVWYPAAAPGGALEPTLEAVVDTPPNTTGAPYPVIMWSHGNRGSPHNYSHYLSHLASWGFVVVAPLHRGTSRPGPDCHGGCTDRDGSEQDWVTDRPEDLSYVLGQALALSAGGDLILGGMLDAGRVGGAGHSFGGWTTMALMASKHPYKAAVAMAPGAPVALMPLMTGFAASDSEPLMYLVASLDSGVRVPYHQAAYKALPAGSEHWLLTLQRGGHSSFANHCAPVGLIGISCEEALPDDVAHTIIDRWTTAFLLQRVTGDPRYGPYLNGLRTAGDPNLQLQVAGR